MVYQLGCGVHMCASLLWYACVCGVCACRGCVCGACVLVRVCVRVACMLLVKYKQLSGGLESPVVYFGMNI